MILAKAIFAAGCFWGIQSAFNATPGVVSTEVGYIGGTLKDPTYQDVSTGMTGHAEAVEVIFDPAKVTYEQLLEVFFSNHNPTTLNRQGPDIGTQYRSAIFYEDTAQETAALNIIDRMTLAHKYQSPIVTQVLPAETFYPAEDYHQNYLQKRGKTSCSVTLN